MAAPNPDQQTPPGTAAEPVPPADLPPHTPGAGWELAKQVLGWPDLPDDPQAEAAFQAKQDRAQEEARRFYGIDAA